MSHEQYRAVLVYLGWSQARAADEMGLCRKTSSGYANGKPIPLLVARFLAHEIRLHKATTK